MIFKRIKMNFMRWKSIRSISFWRWVALFATVALIASDCGEEADDAPGSPVCAAGEAGPECAPCEAGMFCPGGEQAAVACEAGTWDDDADPASACVAWTDCAVGEFVATSGSAIKDRACASCGPNRYSETVNAETCLLGSACAAGEFVATPGTPTTELSCAACPSEIGRAH